MQTILVCTLYLIKYGASVIYSTSVNSSKNPKFMLTYDPMFEGSNPTVMRKEREEIYKDHKTTIIYSSFEKPNSNHYNESLSKPLCINQTRALQQMIEIVTQKIFLGGVCVIVSWYSWACNISFYGCN